MSDVRKKSEFTTKMSTAEMSRACLSSSPGRLSSVGGAVAKKLPGVAEQFCYKLGYFDFGIWEAGNL